jgi:hypothetical protein
MTYRWVSDWMIGFIDTIYIPLWTTGSTALHYFHTLQFTVTHTSVHSLHNSLTVTLSHTQSLLWTAWFLAISFQLFCQLANKMGHRRLLLLFLIVKCAWECGLQYTNDSWDGYLVDKKLCLCANLSSKHIWPPKCSTVQTKFQCV